LDGFNAVVGEASLKPSAQNTNNGGKVEGIFDHVSKRISEGDIALYAGTYQLMENYFATE